MNTTIINSSASTESSPPPFSKFIISFVVSFVAFSLAVIAVLFVVLFIDAIKSNEKYHESIPVLLLSAAWLALVYGVIASIVSATPFIVLGAPAALIGWKLKLIRWWSCLFGAGLLSISPVVLILMLNTLVRFVFRERLPDSSELIANVGFLLALGFCGSVSGLCFWLTLRLFRFSDINGPIIYPLHFPK